MNNNSVNNLFLNQKVVQTATNYTVLANDVIIEVTSTAAPRTITLPSPSANNSGKFYIIKDTSGAAVSNNISVVPASGTIDGSGALLIGTNYGAIQVYSDGTSYYSQAFVTPQPTGIALASGYWAKTGSNFLVSPGQPSAGFTTPMHTSGAAIFSNLTADHVTSITVSGATLTIVRPGLYLLNISSAIYPNSSNASGGVCQIVKNNSTLILASGGFPYPGLATFLGGTMTTNLVAGDQIDFRFGITSGYGYWFNTVAILVQQLPTTF
jgi:hypothetical protein